MRAAAVSGFAAAVSPGGLVVCANACIAGASVEESPTSPTVLRKRRRPCAAGSGERFMRTSGSGEGADVSAGKLLPRRHADNSALHEIAQHRREDAAVAVVVHLDRRVEPCHRM